MELIGGVSLLAMVVWFLWLLPVLVPVIKGDTAGEKFMWGAICLFLSYLGLATYLIYRAVRNN